MTPPEHADLNTRRRRLLFRSTHRGTHEADLLIGGFVTAGLAGFTAAELDALEAVMEWPDVELSDWLIGRVPVPAEADSPMFRRMRDAVGAGRAGGCMDARVKPGHEGEQA